MELTTRIVLASRPAGRPALEHFRLETVPLPTLGEHQVLVRNDWLSIDPYMRGRMMDIRTYAEPVGLGEVMVGDTAGEVVASRHPGFKPGDTVAGTLGWQRFAVALRPHRPVRRHLRAGRPPSARPAAAAALHREPGQAAGLHRA